jgi:hypothetical protein
MISLVELQGFARKAELSLHLGFRNISGENSPSLLQQRFPMFAKLFQQCGERGAFRRGERFKHGLQPSCVDLENPPDQCSPRSGQRDKGNAAIIRAGLTANQSLFFEAIDCGGNRTASQHYLTSDRIHRQRALMQEDFQDREIRQAESGISYTSGIHLSEGSVGFHENEPKMNPGNNVRAGISFAHVVIFISRYFSGKSFFTEFSLNFLLTLALALTLLHDSISGLM